MTLQECFNRLGKMVYVGDELPSVGRFGYWARLIAVCEGDMVRITNSREYVSPMCIFDSEEEFNATKQQAT